MGRFPAIALAAAGLAVLWDAGTASAQSGELERRLAGASRIECRFDVVATGRWEDDAPGADVASAELETVFFDINVEEGTADAEGDFGATFIVVRHAGGYLHFMQMSDAGPLHLTTVLAQETADGRLKAVHTRHEYSRTALPGFTSRPEMYVGDCALAD